jgi:hypothetical protein
VLPGGATVIDASPAAAVDEIPVVGSTAEMVALPVPTISMRLLSLAALGIVATVSSLEW